MNRNYRIETVMLNGDMTLILPAGSRLLTAYDVDGYPHLSLLRKTDATDINACFAIKVIEANTWTSPIMDSDEWQCLGVIMQYKSKVLVLYWHRTQ